MASVEAVAAAAAGAVAGGAAIGVLPEGTTPPEQQQMPGRGVQPPGLGAVPALVPTIDQRMALLVQQQMQMAEMMKTFSADKASGKEHLANARLGERNFRRIKVFTEKRENWRGWEMHFASSIRECDAPFADYLLGYREEPGR